MRHSLLTTIALRGGLATLAALLALSCAPRPTARAVGEADSGQAAAQGDEKAAASWSHWRGPEQNGVSRERDLPEKFSLEKGKGSNLIFTAPVGGLGTPIVQDGQVYVLSRKGEGQTQQESVVAVDADSGAVKWRHDFNIFHSAIVDDRLAFTNMAGDPETGNVYAHLTAGQFLCFDKKGKVVWERSLTDEFGRVTGYGGRVTSPIVDEDKVLVSFVGGSWGEQTIGMTRMVAFDKKTGQIIWWAAGGQRVKDTYYSNPVVAFIGGQRLVLTGGGDGHVHAFKARTGEKVWSYMLEHGGGAINASPVVKGDKVWIAHGEENRNVQGSVVCLDGGKVKDGEPALVWKVDGIKVKFASPVLHEGRLYVCDETGRLYCLDADSGKRVWRFSYGTATKGSPVWADGKIYISEVDGAFHVLKPGPDKCARLSKVEFASESLARVELHGSPAVVNGRVYFTTTEQLVCIGKEGHKAKPDAIPAAPKEEARPEASKATHLQVVPADVTLSPGEKAELTAFTYDDHGRRIGKVKVDWSPAGQLPPVFPAGVAAPKPAGKATAPPPVSGKLSATSGESTTFTAGEKPNGQFGRVVAKGAGLTAHARVRVLPTLPYSQDFTNVPDGRTPGAWVNAPGKYSVVTLDGNKVLSKRNDTANPILNRVNAYITGPNASDYTIECDVSSTKVRGFLGDMGVGAQGYSLWLLGKSQQLRLVTWDAMPRIEKKVSFKWKEGTWYRLKLTATVEGGKGVVKGKVWPRDEKEPEKWTLELSDPIPNKDGSALVYGFSNGAIDATSPGPAIYYDNLKITPNKKK